MRSKDPQSKKKSCCVELLVIFQKNVLLVDELRAAAKPVSRERCELATDLYSVV